MSMTLETLKTRKLPIVRGLLALNVLICSVVLIAWQAAVLMVLDPLSWAAASDVGRDRSVMALLSYPFAMFWVAPTMAALAGWSAVKARKYTMAAAIMLAPVLLALLTVGLYVAVEKYRLGAVYGV